MKIIDVMEKRIEKFKVEQEKTYNSYLLKKEKYFSLQKKIDNCNTYDPLDIMKIQLIYSKYLQLEAEVKAFNTTIAIHNFHFR